jgi:AraC-like DNA-binding protein
MVWIVPELPDATLAHPPPSFTPAFLRPIAVALGHLGLTAPAFIAKPPGNVPVIPVLESLEALAVEAGAPDLGIKIVKNLPLGAVGLADYRFSASANLGLALASFADKQTEFVDSIRYDTIIEPTYAKIEMVRRFRFPQLYPIGEAFAMALVMRRLRDVLGDAVAKLEAARLVFPRPSSTKAFDDFFGVEVEFGADSYEIRFSRDLLAAPLFTASPELAAVLSTRAAASPEPFIDRVRAAIDELLAEESPRVDILEAARIVGMTPRSLQRRLREKNASFSTLLDDARRDLAKKLLAREGMLVCAIAYRLGFSSVAAFFRAFRRWTGLSPRQFQRALITS